MGVRFEVVVLTGDMPGQTHWHVRGEGETPEETEKLGKLLFERICGDRETLIRKEPLFLTQEMFEDRTKRYLVSFRMTTLDQAGPRHRRVSQHLDSVVYQTLPPKEG